ncbi:zinc ABC transporter ATP-binding protein [Candidatus Magnetomorum sp. HK-1]|nr:zinc ABC transporter ATP-binding protein [Candidatus Magnetomorum sp. HK-1]
MKSINKQSPLIQVNNVFFAYHRRTVLENINLSVHPKDYIAIIGPNGGGKTTLFKLILGLLKPKSGSIQVLGQDPQKKSKHIGYVPQDHHFNRHFPISVMDIVLMGSLSPKKRLFCSQKKNRQKALEILDQLNMANFAQKSMRELSGGQRQRIFIARALMTSPKMLLLDEPTTGIDPKGQTEFYALLEELNKNITILMVSHDMMILSSHVKSVACINRRLFYHDQSEISETMIKSMYPGALTAECPIELISHGLPHRVLKHHHKIGLKND